MLELSLREIKEDDITNKLSLGHADYRALKSFLIDHAIEFNRQHLSKTYVLVEQLHSPSRIWGYISLTSSEIHLDTNENPLDIDRAERFKIFPAIKIGRLAIDSKIRNFGKGKELIEYCILIARNDIMNRIGCRYIVVDSKLKSIGFYQKLGFSLSVIQNNSQDNTRLMFYDLYKNDIELYKLKETEELAMETA